ncbi:hypothetical protein SAMN04487897_114113 [Paenibacillus sp. yr247]|uniref:hypothetical protein n=1 Tax=Paenibacillus sp. yr247 TaxID=1761880 RepID=UPI00088F400A|nr:hypothetical protein [Paenibacillus sp. yr247]SDO45714.1 hypothetical protein SAMN04487897_114113 [Paenibacillus sp. yr247]
MSKVFVEYAIKSTYRESFLIYMQQWQRREGRLELLEGTDQCGLFVEIWNGVTYEEYISLKQDRLHGSVSASHQAAWEDWIEGGLRKLHIWHFSQVTST